MEATCLPRYRGGEDADDRFLDSQVVSWRLPTPEYLTHACEMKRVGTQTLALSIHQRGDEEKSKDRESSDSGREISRRVS